MLCFLTARRLKPGAFDQFRRAWEPPEGETPPGLIRAYHARNVRDEDEIVSFGLFDASLSEVREWRAAHEAEELARQDAMAAFVENVSADGMYEVIDTLEP
jgi:heme-degrading monooxygenase HmoA